MSKLFGSLTGGADSFISGMAAQLNMITSIINSISNTVNVVISDVLSGINAAISEINGIASQITTLIASEVAALASVINELLNFASISTLFGLVNNTCAKQVLSAVGTPAMQTALGISP
jgi:phage-related protein